MVQFSLKVKALQKLLVLCFIIYCVSYIIVGASQVVLAVKNLPASAANIRDAGSLDPGFRKIIWRRVWQPTPVSLPGESHGQSSLAGFSP